MAKLPEWDIWGIEYRWWYDWVACWEDRNTWKRYSVRAHIPIDDDELCRYGNIYKVEHDWDDPFNFDYKILSERPDEDGNEPTEVS